MRIPLEAADTVYGDFCHAVELATPSGFEPLTYRLGICCSILLSYGAVTTFLVELAGRGKTPGDIRSCRRAANPYSCPLGQVR